MEPFYRDDLARIHDEGFSGYADSVAPGLLEILGDQTEVLELGCGSGALTKYLVAQGHEVLATDASRSMLDLAELKVPGARFEVLVLGEDPVPDAASIVSIGHVVNYLQSAREINDVVVAMARAKDPGGVLIFDICDLSYGLARQGVQHSSADGDGWSVDVTTIFEPPDRFIRGMTTRIGIDQARPREGHETHVNTLISVEELIAELTDHGFGASASPSLGGFELPIGMFAVVVTGQSNT